MRLNAAGSDSRSLPTPPLQGPAAGVPRDPQRCNDIAKQVMGAVTAVFVATVAAMWWLTPAKLLQATVLYCVGGPLLKRLGQNRTPPPAVPPHVVNERIQGDPRP